MPKKKVRRVTSHRRTSRSSKPKFNLIKVLIVGVIGFIFALVLYSLVNTATPPPHSSEDVLAAKDVKVGKTGVDEIDQILKIVTEEDGHDVTLGNSNSDEAYIQSLLQEASSYAASDPGTD